MRSIISAQDILSLIKVNYVQQDDDSLCILEYRGINDIYHYIHSNTSYFFKVYSRNYLSLIEIESEVKIINYLHNSGISVSEPILNKSNNYIITINTSEGVRYGILFSNAEGISIDNDTIGVKKIEKIGSFISKIHSILDTMEDTVNRWKLDETIFIDESMKHISELQRFHEFDYSFVEELSKRIKVFLSQNKNQLNYGLCHGDFYTGNIHEQNGKLTMIDFDFCGYGWRSYDIAMFIGGFSWGFNKIAIEKRQRRLDSFLKGYMVNRNISNFDIEQSYKIFIPFRRIFNMGWLYDQLLYVWGNKYRIINFNNDLKLLKEWVDHYN